jgi:uncharacterized membrane protein
MTEIKYPQESVSESAAGGSNGHRQTNKHEDEVSSLNNHRPKQWKQTGRSLGSIVAGGALAAYGVTRKSLGGAAIAAAGSLLAYRGLRRATSPAAVHVERSFTINRPVSDVYEYFRNFENLPTFMHHLRAVHITGERTSHWIAQAPFGFELEWDAEIVNEESNRFLTWQSLPGAVVPNRGSVEFRAASEYHGGTEIMVAMDYAPPAGRGGALFARVFGQEPGMQIREDLRRLKQVLEAGEIPTTEGQSHGRRTAFVRMMHAVNQSPARKWQTQAERDWADVS